MTGVIDFLVPYSRLVSGARYRGRTCTRWATAAVLNLWTEDNTPRPDIETRVRVDRLEEDEDEKDEEEDEDEEEKEEEKEEEEEEEGSLDDAVPLACL